MKRMSPFNNLSEYISSCASSFPDNTVMQIRRGFTTEKYSYKELDRLMRQCASYLYKTGLRKGDCVLIWGPNMPEWVVALLGVLSIGAVSVPVSMHATPETVDEYLRQTNAKFLLRSRFVNDRKRRGVTAIDLEDVITSSRKYEEMKLPKIKPDDVAEIMYTSGTTGDPSGVVLSHGNILEGLEGLRLLVPPSSEFRLLSILPLSHALEQLLGFFTLIRFGATVYYVPRINPVVIVRSLNRYKITHLIVVPELIKVMWNSIELQAQQKGALLKLQKALKIAPHLPMSLRRVLFKDVHKAFGGKLKLLACAGAPLDVWVGENWEKIGVVVLEGYGLTETSAALTANQIHARKIGSVGKLLPGVEVRFSKDGEVLTRGLNVTKGYYKNAKKTKESFTSEGFFKTGDVGYVGKDGFVYLTGRKKFKIVIPTGEKVYPEDVERSLNDHPAVKESCVIGIKKDRGEIVHAVLILKRDIDPATVIAQVNSQLESHQTILEWSLWKDDDFPRTRSLKKDRNRVKEYVMGTITSSSSDLPQDSKATTSQRDPLKDIISAVFSVDAHSITENTSLVFDLHMDSLRRIALVSLIEDEFGVVVSEQDLVESTKVENVRILIKEGKKSVESKAIPSWPTAPFTVIIRDLIRTFLFFPISRLTLARIEIVNKEVVKNMKGPSIIAFNHVGHLEPLMIMVSLRRAIQKKLFTLADADGFYLWIRRFFLYFFAGAFPVEKHGGPVRQTLELAADLLEDGWSLLMSPEGNRSSDGNLLEFKQGTGMIAVETRVPVYPVKVKGYREAHVSLKKGIFDVFFDFAKPGKKVTLVFGEPIVFDPNTSHEQATEKIRSVIENL